MFKQNDKQRTKELIELGWKVVIIDRNNWSSVHNIVKQEILNKLKEITPKEFKALRKKQYFKQRRICPILKRKIPYSEAVFDHKHKSRKEKLGEERQRLIERGLAVSS